MIRLHRLGHASEDFHLNPDLIASIEATPDTVVTLTTHTKLIVSERPGEVVEAIRPGGGAGRRSAPGVRRPGRSPCRAATAAGATRRCPSSAPPRAIPPLSPRR